MDLHIAADEVIADSEDEMEDMQSFSGPKPSISSVSAFTTTGHNNNPQKIMSSISNFNTSRLEDEISAEPSSIADRAKTRQRTQQSKSTAVDLIELTSDEETSTVAKNSKVPEQSKPKPKPKPKPRLKTKEEKDPPAEPNVIAVNEEPPRPRPRPRPRPIIKRNRTILDSDPLPPHPYPFGRDALPGANTNIHSTPNRNQPEIPIATSPSILNPKTSQLPPSDPPHPTMTTVSENNAPPLPPIEILPPDRDSDREGGKRASSPASSLFGDRMTSRKRRRRGDDMDNEPEVDQLMSSSPARPGLVRAPAAPVLGAYSRAYGQVTEEDHAMPPTFFAGSSSSAGRNEEPPEPFVPPQQQQPEIVDLTDLPPTMAVTGGTGSSSKKLPKPRKSRKSKAQPDSVLDAQLTTGALDKDELDGDFDPACEGTTEKLAKGKKKTSAKKKEPAKKRKEQMDGVLLPSRKKSTKGKGKEKEGGVEEVFKSREFIEDSDEDDPLRLVGGTEAEQPSVVISRPRSTLSRIALGSPSTPSTSGLNLDPTTAKSTSTPKLSPSDASKSSSTKGRKETKKRKSLVDADEDVNEGTGVDEGDSIVVKRRKKAILSDEDDAEPSSNNRNGKKVAEKRADAKKRQPARRKKATQREKEIPEPVVSDDGGDNVDTNIDQHDATPVEEMEVQIPEKENATPTPLASTPSKTAPTAVKPRSRAFSMNADGTTPLYARYEVAPRRSSLPMSELIRRASSKPGSLCPPPPLLTPSVKNPVKNKLSTDATTSSTPSTPLSRVMAYSPYLKSSRRALSKIAPLHPNRRTPPPPPPPPPPKKKTKKELEREEKWEEELVESVGGIEVWASMGEADRKEMRRAKRDIELGGYED